MKFAQNTSLRTQEKLRYATSVLKTVHPIPTKFVKKLTNTDFYEMRISADNSVRVILYSVDHDNIHLAKTIVFLNGFIKKSNKDYIPEVAKAMKILRSLL